MTFLDATSTAAAPDRVSLAEPRDFLALLKPRVMSLVVLTAITGLVMAPGDLHPTLAFIAILSIAMGAGASGALNMWYDADIDRLMTRTAQRPVAAGRIAPETALGFGVGLSCLSVMMLGLATNWFAAALLAFTIFFYAVIYTMGLKRRTPQNIVIGGAAGAFPPMIGWAAVTGGVALESIVLFLIIFLWTPPHFWALALFKLKDYGSAGVPMLPNVAGERATRNQIFLYSLILVPVAVAPWLLGFAGPVYGIAAIVLGANFLRHAYATLRMPDGDAQMVPAKKLFAFSIFYLFGLFAILLVEGIVGGMVSTGGL
ncbi:MAG: heme o synthase [Aurantimonas endophytica]|uniref:Protoheme IX farnesyltransferase n=1 Tax=Aurantimonas endophytica TaxID=1522175 RepID=A0A7W6HDD5_9HYPH|nr:heme o synthase [Aurantimonas endophytica]MBB4002982.1 protoheme IX farnesyltransferase [Aurantimonas endophytica]MCO6403858.1 protoheme IX farnesyltransferase [Aurantimonas endophytica]